MKRFIPVKITNKKWADKLMAGELFFRPLKDFRPRPKEVSEINNHYRGDFAEGALAAYTDFEQDVFLRGFSDEDKNCINEAIKLDMGDAQYYKLLCLYSLEYDDSNNCFIMPDQRIKNFGDTAVIIRDFDEFLRRLLTAILKEKEHTLFWADKVRYFSPQENRKICIPFEKTNDYSWQNEFRLVYGDLLQLSTDDFRIIYDDSPKTWKIGDIRDIAEAIPVDSFLDLSFLPFVDLKFPMSEKVKPPFMQKKTLLEMIVDDTRKKMVEYNSTMATWLVKIKKDNQGF